MKTIDAFSSFLLNFFCLIKKGNDIKVVTKPIIKQAVKVIDVARSIFPKDAISKTSGLISVIAVKGIAIVRKTTEIVTQVLVLPFDVFRERLRL